MIGMRPTKTEDPPCGGVVTLSVTGYFISGFHNLKQNKTKALSQWQLLKGKGLILLYELKTHELQHVNRKTSSFSAFSNVQSYTKCSFPVTRTSLAIIAYIP